MASEDYRVITGTLDAIVRAQNLDLGGSNEPEGGAHGVPPLVDFKADPLGGFQGRQYGDEQPGYSGGCQNYRGNNGRIINVRILQLGDGQDYN